MIAALRAALADRYAFGPELGRGGMATVYRARDLKHDRDVAIKVLDPEHTALVGANRFLQEIRVVAHLNHPGIVPLHDSGEAAGLLYYVMPCIEGESLRERLERDRQLGVADALRITREVADGLSYAHELGVIHRDIKPENILLSRGHALVADFGIARAVADAGTGTLTRSGTFVGTPLYSSPEQASGERVIDARADLYSLACVVFEMLAGEPPFTGPTQQAVLAKHALETRPSVRTVRDTVPQHIDEALQRAMARVPADRFDSVAAFLHAIESAPPAKPHAGEPRSRRRRIVAAVGALAVLITAAFLLVPGAARLRRAFMKPAAAYAGMPAWSDWVDVSGEHFMVFATMDSGLVVHTAGADSLYSYDGRRWTGFGIPEGFSLRPYDGFVARPRLLATRPYSDGLGRGHEYWWLEITGDDVHPAERLPDFGPDRVFPRWWSDGVETVAWADGIDHLEIGQWVRESIGTAGRIQALWGRDFQHRYAITSTAPDSLLVYDGISWRVADIMPTRTTLVPSFSSGYLLRDGTSVVLGELCDSVACSSLILEQDTFGGSWRRVEIADAIGLPSSQAVAVDECESARFALDGAGGASRDDYYVWGVWVRCARLPVRRVFSGCPPDWPCIWHVSAGRLEPVPEFRGHVVEAVQAAAGTLFALAEDGTLWRRVDGRWRPVDQVPDLPDRSVAASRAVIVASEGRRASYEPGPADTISGFFITPLTLPARSGPGDIRALAVRDSAIALLTEDGAVFHSTCGVIPEVLRAARAALRCAPLLRMSGGPSVSAVALLSPRDVLAVGAREVVRWRDGQAIREPLPRDAAGDTLWGVSVDAAGTATIAGARTLLQRDTAGTWLALRSFASDAATAGEHLAVLPDGNVVIAAGWLRVWERAADSAPLAVLHSPMQGQQITALHALADGRLVAGFASDAPGVGGWIQVWASPVQAGQSERVALPLNVDVTSLADDGSRLIVAGRGGSMAIPLSALPFTPAPSRD